MTRRLLPLLFLLCTFCSAQSSSRLQMGSIGDLKLESGEVIRDCKVAYRTFGALNANKDNAILVTTWFTGDSSAIIGLIGPGKFIDSSKYYVIVADALGDGFSSSPSNSKLQPRMKFPRFTIRDMVTSQHELLTRVLHLSHLLAVSGSSMGGMQTFQWVVSYPDFMDKAIPITGTPRQTAHDTVLWNSEVTALQQDPGRFPSRAPRARPSMTRCFGTPR